MPSRARSRRWPLAACYRATRESTAIDRAPTKNSSSPTIGIFVDRGESAKTADRPELQRLLEFVTEQPVKYLVVHKVDRLARNRVNDVAINPGDVAKGPRPTDG